MTIPLGRHLHAASSNQPERLQQMHHWRAGLRWHPASFLFGLAPGGACRAGDIAAPAVRSCRTLSPLPLVAAEAAHAGGLLSVALSLNRRSRPGPPGVTRHHSSVEPGLSSPCSDRRRSSDPLTWHQPNALLPACQLLPAAPLQDKDDFNCSESLTMPPLTPVVLVSMLLVASLGGCSVFRQGAGEFEKVAARNEAGQLITPNAPSEGQQPLPDGEEATPTSMATNQVLDMGRAAKSLPSGLAGDTGNVNHIGDAVPPR
jgi:hypothetical protein